jgi:hypothetical protein
MTSFARIAITQSAASALTHLQNEASALQTTASDTRFQGAAMNREKVEVIWRKKHSDTVEQLRRQREAPSDFS